MPTEQTVVIHTRVGGFGKEDGGSEIEGGPVISDQTAWRLLCSGRVQAVLENEAGDAIRISSISPEPPPWMMRQLKYRDVECRFPGCGSKRFAQAHHIVWRRNGGKTNLGKLILVCGFHHKLVHEYGWKVTRDRHGTARWRRSDGSLYFSGPGPPGKTGRQPAMSAAAM